MANSTIKNAPTISSQLYKRFVGEDNISISANSDFVKNLPIPTVEGYTPFGIIGLQLANASSNGTNVSYVAYRTTILLSENIQVSGRNFGSSAAKIKIMVTVLYIKAE